MPSKNQLLTMGRAIKRLESISIANLSGAGTTLEYLLAMLLISNLSIGKVKYTQLTFSELRLLIKMAKAAKFLEEAVEISNYLYTLESQEV